MNFALMLQKGDRMICREQRVEQPRITAEAAENRQRQGKEQVSHMQSQKQKLCIEGSRRALGWARPQPLGTGGSGMGLPLPGAEQATPAEDFY